ncbi:NUDIX hydrolase [Pseudahrensia aquimaris]|uniref:NUDIX hydrolase n=1 Tax=Pseudahrensia aquimaris TaxID=744461 RepID=A0ABW3FBD5_9HYPH
MRVIDEPQYSAAAFCKRLEERFARRADVMAAIGGDDRLNPGDREEFMDRDFKHAAVLIPVIDRGDDAHVLLTQRAEHLSSHKGQIAFPGGKIDPGETPEEAATREAWEEVGLNDNAVQLIGTFGDYYSGSGYRITPVAAKVRPDYEMVINEDEVASAFEVPLSFLMDRENHRIESLTWKERERHFFAMPFMDESVNPPVERRIWGVTAGIIRMVQERVYGG